MTTRDQAEELDRNDPLRAMRDEFVLPDGVIYLDGNSLGALPKSIPDRIAHVIRHEWGERLVRSWNEAGWWVASRRVARRLAPLLGASADEVAVADSTSVNLFKLLIAGLRLRPDRPVLVAERDAFPSDVYIAGSVAELIGGQLRLIDGPDDLPAALDQRVGVVGAVDVDLNSWGADLAVGCGYKYLNGGPGAPAYAFVAAEHHSRLRTPLPGWHGHAEPFAMSPDYRPAPGIGQLADGTPPMLSLLALEEAVELLAGVSTADLRAKSVGLTTLFVELVTARCPDIEVVTPRDPARRGSQVSLRLPNAFPLVRELIERGVVGDFRAPDIARFGFAPTYLRHVDVWDAVERITDVLTSGDHLTNQPPTQPTVT